MNKEAARLIEAALGELEREPNTENIHITRVRGWLQRAMLCSPVPGVLPRQTRAAMQIEVRPDRMSLQVGAQAFSWSMHGGEVAAGIAAAMGRHIVRELGGPPEVRCPVCTSHLVPPAPSKPELPPQTGPVCGQCDGRGRVPYQRGHIKCGRCNGDGRPPPKCPPKCSCPLCDGFGGMLDGD